MELMKHGEIFGCLLHAILWWYGSLKATFTAFQIARHVYYVEGTVPPAFACIMYKKSLVFAVEWYIFSLYMVKHV